LSACVNKKIYIYIYIRLLTQADKTQRVTSSYIMISIKKTIIEMDFIGIIISEFIVQDLHITVFYTGLSECNYVRL